MKRYTLRYEIYYEGVNHLCFIKSFSTLSRAVSYADEFINKFRLTIHIRTVRVYGFGRPVTVKEVIL